MTVTASGKGQCEGRQHGDIAELFERNTAWSARKTRSDPGFFQRLLGQQRPRYFWIGCSDSRVPATEIVDLDPGEMFVHRNVANLAEADDPNFMAALQFAVEVLEVAHVIVVGHYGCGGVDAAMSGTRAPGAIGRWLEPLRTLHRHMCSESKARTVSPDDLCRANVSAQVAALARNPVIRSAWARGADLTLHGWVYAIGDGLLHPVCTHIGRVPDNAVRQAAMPPAVPPHPVSKESPNG